MQALGWALAVLALLILSAMLVLLGLNAARIEHHVRSGQRDPGLGGRALRGRRAPDHQPPAR
jgi:hypothetical protein